MAPAKERKKEKKHTNKREDGNGVREKSRKSGMSNTEESK